MEKLRLSVYSREEFLDDVDKLQKQLNNAGYSATKQDISFAWECFSNTQCAQWLCLSNNEEENVKEILQYFEVERN